MTGFPTASGLIGRTIGNYVVRERIGHGGMGAVYLAEHPRIHRKVAIKVLHPELGQDPEIVARFFNEARAANDIKNEHIVEIIDFGELPEGTSYFIMEWLEGRSLGDALKGGRLPLDQAAHITTGVGRALTAAHSRGVIHRDLKPDNIYLVRRDDDTDFVKVLDFGIAKLLASTDGSAPKTATNVVMGTPAYMSPEQCRGESSKLDARSDVYSLGVIVYEMVTGKRPFHSETYTGILVAHLTQPPPAPRSFDPSVPDAVEKVVLQALEKEPDKRFQSVAELVNALSAAVGTRGMTWPRVVLHAPAPDENVVGLDSDVGASDKTDVSLSPPDPSVAPSVAPTPKTPLAIAPTPSLPPAAKSVDPVSDTGMLAPARSGPKPRTIAIIGAIVVSIGVGVGLAMRMPAAPPEATSPTPSTNADVVPPPGPAPVEAEKVGVEKPAPPLPAAKQPEVVAAVEPQEKRPEAVNDDAPAATHASAAKPAVPSSVKDAKPDSAHVPSTKPAHQSTPAILDPYADDAPPAAKPIAKPLGKPPTLLAEPLAPKADDKVAASDRGGDELDKRLSSEAAHLAPGAHRVGQKLRGEGDDGEGQDRYFALEEGRCYTIVSVGTSPRLYTYLWNPDGQRVADHRSDTNVSHFEICAETSGQYRFQAKPARGAGEFRTAIYLKR